MVEAITNMRDVIKIKKSLLMKPKYHLLFTIGVNSSLKVKTLLNLRHEDLKNVQSGETIYLGDYPKDKSDSFLFNTSIQQAFEHYLNYIGDNSKYLFRKKHSSAPIKQEYLTYLVKSWCRQAEIPGNFGGQSLRKTFGYLQVTYHSVDISIISKNFNHAFPGITRKYLGLPKKTSIKEI